MSNLPLVSIIIPLHNAEKYITATLQSTYEQTYPHIEVICVNDVSTDNSAIVAQEFIADKPNYQLLHTTKNLKLSGTRNMAITAAKGHFILPLDADDIIDKTYCDQAIAIFKNQPEVAVVYAKAKKFNQHKSWSWQLPPYNKKLIRWQNMVYCSAFFRKSDWLKYGGYSENMTLGFEDWNFWLHFAKDDKIFYCIDAELFWYRQNDDSMIQQLSNNQHKVEHMFRHIRKNHPDIYRWYYLYKLWGKIKHKFRFFWHKK